jgi:hypothetical protein
LINNFIRLLRGESNRNAGMGEKVTVVNTKREAAKTSRSVKSGR